MCRNDSFVILFSFMDSYLLLNISCSIKYYCSKINNIVRLNRILLKLYEKEGEYSQGGSGKAGGWDGNCPVRPENICRPGIPGNFTGKRRKKRGHRFRSGFWWWLKGLTRTGNLSYFPAR